MDIIKKLLPEGSIIEFNPKKLKEANLVLSTLSKDGTKIVDFPYTSERAYDDVQVEAEIISYEDGYEDGHQFIVLSPIEKPELILFIHIDNDYRDNINFLCLKPRKT